MKKNIDMLEIIHQNNKEAQTRTRIENQLKEYREKEAQKKEAKKEKIKNILTTTALILAIIPLLLLKNNMDNNDLKQCKENGLSENVCYNEVIR